MKKLPMMPVNKILSDEDAEIESCHIMSYYIDTASFGHNAKINETLSP